MQKRMEKTKMKNSDVAHNFFYASVGEHFNRSSMTVSYDYAHYFSYSTCIAELTQDTDGKHIYIISDNNFSNTTAKHIGELKRACPIEYVLLPQSIYNKEFYTRETFEHIEDNLKYYANANLNQKFNRENLKKYYNMLQDLARLEKWANYKNKIQELLSFYEVAITALEAREAEAEAKKAIREANKREKLKKALAEMTSLSITELAKMAYTKSNNQELKAKIRDYINPNWTYSFIWLNGENINTSQGITVNAKEVFTLLQLWKHNKLKHGATISRYTVLEVMPDYVKVGCHKIPTANLEALYNDFMALEAPAREVA